MVEVAVAAADEGGLDGRDGHGFLLGSRVGASPDEVVALAGSGTGSAPAIRSPGILAGLLLGSNEPPAAAVLVCREQAAPILASCPGATPI